MKLQLHYVFFLYTWYRYDIWYNIFDILLADLAQAYLAILRIDIPVRQPKLFVA